jgi:hypothetical protein
MDPKVQRLSMLPREHQMPGKISSRFQGSFLLGRCGRASSNTSGFERTPHFTRWRPDWPAGAAGFEPLHLGLQLAQDSQPGREDSNLCILESGSQLGARTRTCVSRITGAPAWSDIRVLTRRDRTLWLRRQDSNLCILESEFTQTLSPWGRTRTCASRIKGAPNRRLDPVEAG